MRNVDVVEIVEVLGLRLTMSAEKRIRFVADAGMQVRVGDHRVYGETKRTAEIDAGDHRSDEGERHVRFRQELRVVPVQFEYGIGDVRRFPLPLCRRVRCVDGFEHFAHIFSRTPHLRRRHQELGQRALNVGHEYAVLVGEQLADEVAGVDTHGEVRDLSGHVVLEGLRRWKHVAFVQGADRLSTEGDQFRQALGECCPGVGRAE